MKWLADENVDQRIVDALRDLGNEVIYAAETTPGSTDEHVLAMAARESALLLTADKDFGELVDRQGRASFGVVLLRLAGMPSSEKAQLGGSALSRRMVRRGEERSQS